MGKHIHTFWRSEGVTAYRSEIDGPVTILGNVEIKDSRIKGNSFIHAVRAIIQARIASSDLDSCFISGPSGIYNSRLTECQIASSWVERCVMGKGGIVINSNLLHVKTEGFAFIENANINTISKKGDPPFKLKAGTRITGEWFNRPAPEVILVNDFGYITEGLDGTCWVGCKLHDTRHWLRHSAKYFQRLNLPEKTREGILNAVQEISRLQGGSAIHAKLHRG